jgi:hypothetical protein
MQDYPENITLVIHYVNKDTPTYIHTNKYNFVTISIETQTDILSNDTIETQTDPILTEEMCIQTEEEEKVLMAEMCIQTDEEEKVFTEEISIQTEEEEKVLMAEMCIQTDEEEKVLMAEISIQTEEEEKVFTEEIAIQTDDIIVEKEKILTEEIAIQTDDIIVEKEKVFTEEFSIQTDNIFNNDIAIQTDYIMEIKNDIEQILPEILIKNLPNDILLQISNVLSSKKNEMNSGEDAERKKEEKFLREIETRELEKQNKEIIPKIIFIVPYRDREQQYLFFHKQMTKEILVDYSPGSYKIWYIHQCDSRDFNRGAMKNIGFLVTKQLYPNNYKNITLVFNDVDTMPLNRNFLNYETSPGIVKHFYGYEFALGGIVSMNAHDFERINGYPNLWGWGFEDNCLQVRVNKADNLTIDRGQFYPILNKNILQITDGVTRIVNRNEFDQYYHNTNEGIHSIRDLNYDIDENTGFVNIRNFNTGREQDLAKRKVHDLRNGPAPFHPNDKNQKNVRKKNMMGLLF